MSGNEDWSVISVPREVVSLIEKIKKRSGENKDTWKVILEALSYYDSIRSSPRRMIKQDMLEKVSWYVVKLSLAYSSFVLNPSQETFENFNERLEEIKERLKINEEVSVLQRLANEYLQLKDEEERKNERITFNQSFKMIIKEMINKAYEEE